jgi:hypothetical protein
MAENILTAAEAARVLRCATDDILMLETLPLVDDYIRTATGHDWTTDATVNATAKSAARMLLVQWHENPAMQASGLASLSHGLTAALTQLESLALRYQTFAGRNGAGAISLPGAGVGDTVAELIGVIGVSGDQHTAFETVITVKDQIQQLSASDLSAKFYRAYLVPAVSLP